VSVLHGVTNETELDGSTELLLNDEPPEGRAAKSLSSSPQATRTKSRQEIATVTMFPRNDIQGECRDSLFTRLAWLSRRVMHLCNDILSIFPPNYGPPNNRIFSFLAVKSSFFYHFHRHFVSLSSQIF
jgi:hypothetical protein